MKNIRLFVISSFTSLIFFTSSPGQTSDKIRIFIIGSMDKNHTPMVLKSMPMFQKMAEENNFEIHFTRDTSELNFENLSKYQVFIQLSIAYFDFSPTQQFAIQQFINSGRGWIGIHGAGLTGKQFAAKNGRDWKWYWHLLGDAYYIPHPPLQDGVVNVVDKEHPITKNLPPSFPLRDEWYEFENAPSNVHVLAVADETTYKPKKPMGYHPVMWTNPDYHRVLYISVGHDSTSCNSEAYRILLRDAITWAGEVKNKQPKQTESEISVTLQNANYSSDLPKRAMIRSKSPLASEINFTVVDAMTLEIVYSGKPDPSAQLHEPKGDWYSPVRFSNISKQGFYNIQVQANNKKYQSTDFEIGKPFKSNSAPASNAKSKFKVLVLTEHGGHHESFVSAGLDWLKQYSQQEKFEYTEINDPEIITKEFLKDYKLFIQLNYPPYLWTDESKAAFEDYIDNGKGAWIGFHHASLLGEFDGYPMWPWFSNFLGDIRFKNYVAARADGEVHIENRRHPVFAKLPTHFNLPGEEWYTFNKNPREKTEVLATVDENSYRPATDVKMGDHPVIWMNPKKKAKNIYFLFGHHGGLFEVKEFRQLLTNTMKWALK